LRGFLLGLLLDGLVGFLSGLWKGEELTGFRFNDGLYQDSGFSEREAG
jgi:hypothetical protein